MESTNDRPSRFELIVPASQDGMAQVVSVQAEPALSRACSAATRPSRLPPCRDSRPWRPPSAASQRRVELF